MKNLLTICLFLSLKFIYAQKIEVSGIAKTCKQRGHVTIVLNDTLKKLPKNLSDSLFQEIWDNKDIVRFTDENGHFSFKANLKDSLVFSTLGCIPRTVKISEILSKNNSFNIVLESPPCVEYVPCNETNPESYIFIGNKIEVKSASDPNYCNVLSLDHKYKAKYQILQKFTPNVDIEIIEFASYDHASKVKYSEYQNVLLFVGKYCGELIHQKYKYHSVYRTKDGKWASPIFEEYDTTVRKKSNTPPRKVRMAEPIIIPTWLSYKKIEELYPKPYFKIKKGKVYMCYGYYPEDLINM